MRRERLAGSVGAFFVVLFFTGGSLESASFIRGDTDAGGRVDITDAIRVLGHLFLHSPASLDCEEAADTDASGTINITDAVYLLGFLFSGGPAPPAPFPDCGTSPTPGGLGCTAYPSCTELSSFEIIARALAAGEITAETALIYRVFHVFTDERLPAAYRGAAGTLVDTHIIADVIARHDQLSAAGRAVLAPFLVPPSAPGSWLDAGQVAVQSTIEWQTVVSPSGKVKVWSQTRHAGDGAKAAEIAGAVDEMWNKLTGLMRREPIPDGDVGESNGGDAKFDIYLVHIQSPGETCVYESGFSCSTPNPAYLLIDGRQETCLLATVAHEIMHAIQWTYPGKSDCIGEQEYHWWMEASATWAEEYVFRQEKNGCQPAFPFLRQPEEPLEFSGRPYDRYDMHPYGAYLWPYYLERAAGTPDYVRTIWENCTRFDSAVEAIDKSIPDGYRRWWSEFALYNWNSHPEFNYHHDDFHMHVFPADPATGRPRLDGEPSTAVELNGHPQVQIPLFAKVQHLSSIYYHFTFPDEDVRYVAFQHFFDLDANPTARVQAMIQMEGDPDYTYEDWTETPVKTYCRDKPHERLENLVVILTNSEWENRSHVLTPSQDPVLLARDTCYWNAWSGTITNVETWEEDITYHYPDGYATFQVQRRLEHHWEIVPSVLGHTDDDDCESEVLFAAIWTGFASVNAHVESHLRCDPDCGEGLCVKTTTQVDQITSPGLPSGFLVNHRCENLYHVHRAPTGRLGAPGAGLASKPTSSTEVSCDGTFTYDLPPLEARENWGRSRLIFQVTDPSQAEAFSGEEIEEEETPSPVGDGFYRHTDTWTWNLVRDAD